MARIRLVASISLLLAQASFCVADEGAEDFNTRLLRATVKISHDKSTAAGFILSSDDERYVLITAAHVLASSPDDETTIMFRSRQGEGEYKKEALKLAIRKQGQPMWTNHPTEDVAAIRIEPPQNADLPRLSISLLAGDEELRRHRIHPGDCLACLGFPHREEGSEAGFALLREGPIASFPLLPTAKTKTFFLSANTFEGDSGGPVYLGRENSGSPGAEKELILGLVSGQRFLNEEAKMVYGTTQLRHRLGLAVVVHASFIKETIDRLP